MKALRYCLFLIAIFVQSNVFFPIYGMEVGGEVKELSPKQKDEVRGNLKLLLGWNALKPEQPTCNEIATIRSVAMSPDSYYLTGIKEEGKSCKVIVWHRFDKKTRVSIDCDKSLDKVILSPFNTIILVPRKGDIEFFNLKKEKIGEVSPTINANNTLYFTSHENTVAVADGEGFHLLRRKKSEKNYSPCAFKEKKEKFEYFIKDPRWGLFLLTSVKNREEIFLKRYQVGSLDYWNDGDKEPVCSGELCLKSSAEYPVQYLFKGDKVCVYGPYCKLQLFSIINTLEKKPVWELNERVATVMFDRTGSRAVLVVLKESGTFLQVWDVKNNQMQSSFPYSFNNVKSCALVGEKENRLLLKEKSFDYNGRVLELDSLKEIFYQEIGKILTLSNKKEFMAFSISEAPKNNNEGEIEIVNLETGKKCVSCCYPKDLTIKELKFSKDDKELIAIMTLKEKIKTKVIDHTYLFSWILDPEELKKHLEESIFTPQVADLITKAASVDYVLRKEDPVVEAALPLLPSFLKDRYLTDSQLSDRPGGRLGLGGGFLGL